MMDNIQAKIEADRRRDDERRAVRKAVCDDCDRSNVPEYSVGMECDHVFGSDDCASRLLSYFASSSS
jgi:hypothetical protein